MNDSLTQSALHALPFLGIAAVLMLIFRVVFDKLTPYNDRQVAKSGNKAARLTRRGAYLGYIVAIAGSLIMSKQPYKADLMMFALDGVVALAVFVVMYFAADLVILQRINNATEIEKGNVAVATVEFCAYLALGVVMNASFAGGGDRSVASGMLNAALFSAVGLLTVMAVYTVYTIGWSLRGCGLDNQVRLGNRAAAVEAGSLLVAVSVALWGSIIGDFTGWANDLKTYAIAMIYGVVAVSTGRLFASLVLTRNMGRTRRGKHHGSMRKAKIVGLTSIVCGLAVCVLMVM